MLTHHNVLFEAIGTQEAAGLTEAQVGVSYLPLAHIAERVLGLYGPQIQGSHMHAIGDPSQLLAALGEVHPTAFFGVPRVWEKIKTGLSAKPPPTPTRPTAPWSRSRWRPRSRGSRRRRSAA